MHTRFKWKGPFISQPRKGYNQRYRMNREFIDPMVQGKTGPKGRISIRI